MDATATRFSVIMFLLSMTALVVSTSPGGAYGVSPKMKPEMLYKTQQKELPKTIAIQGLIYCKSGPKLIPLKGATARITCLTTNENGVKLAPISVSSCQADDKGYFLAKLSPPSTNVLKNTQSKLKECKAFLENSPLKNCNTPLDINNGITGAQIFSSSSHRLLKNVNLYSVGPFFYTTNRPHAVSNNKGY